MRKYITLLLIVASTTAFAQSKKDMMTKKWKLNKTEEFGQEYAPLDNQKGDWLEFTSDGKFKGIVEGNHAEGTWSASSNATVKFDKTKSKTKVNWAKVKSVAKDKLAIEYQNGDLITSTLIFIPAE